MPVLEIVGPDTDADAVYAMLLNGSTCTDGDLLATTGLSTTLTLPKRRCRSLRAELAPGAF